MSVRLCLFACLHVQKLDQFFTENRDGDDEEKKKSRKLKKKLENGGRAWLLKCLLYCKFDSNAERSICC